VKLGCIIPKCFAVNFIFKIWILLILNSSVSNSTFSENLILKLVTLVVLL